MMELTTLTALVGLLCMAVSWALYTLLASPLRDYPGSLLAKLSPTWIVLQCRRGRRSQAVLDLHREYGDFVRIAPNHISIADPAAVLQIYGHKSGFLKGPFYEDKPCPVSHHGPQIIVVTLGRSPFHQVQPVLFNTRDPQIHQRKKRIMSSAFSAKNLQEFEPHMSKDIRKLVDSFQRRLERSKTAALDFNVYANFLAFDAIGDFTFGEPFGFLDREEDYLNLIDAVDARGEALNALGHVPRSLRAFMKYLPFDSFWLKGVQGTQVLGTLGTRAYFKRRDQASSRKDLLSFLFNAKDPSTGDPLMENEVIAESISFIVGGSDTTSSSMTNIVDIVSRTEAVQRHLREELDVAFPGDMAADWVADFKTVESLPVLNAIVREALRLRPTSATGLERVTPMGGKVIAGRSFPEGTLVSVPTLNIHHNPVVFKDSESFCYERWIGEDSSRLLDSFIPFSVGPRACTGRNFAWMEMLKTLATLFKLFHLERVFVGDTVLREGFFMKSQECEVVLKRRTVQA